MNIDDLINFESEGTSLDFKATQYRKEQYHELLKDVIAMANADKEGEKLIIIGVKKQSDNTYMIIPIPQEEFVDSATYQKLIIDNIEPEIHIDYVAHFYQDNQRLGIVKIPFCLDKPYMMKKAFGTDKHIRRQGESFIRKGTTTLPLMRKDIDKMFEQRTKEAAFTHQVSCYFTGPEKHKVLALHPAKVEKLPSHRQAERIRAIIAKKEKQQEEQKRKAEQDPVYGKLSAQLLSIMDTPSLFGGSTPYENRSLEELRKNLKDVSKTYFDDDLYEFLEKRSEKLNITISNEGTKYIEDAVVEVQIPEIEGLFIADKIYKEPVNTSPYTLYIPQVDTDNLHYSKYKKQVVSIF